MHQNSRPCTTGMATQKEYLKPMARKLSLPHKKETFTTKEDLDWDAHVPKVTNQANCILRMRSRSYENKSQKHRAALQVPCKTTFGICGTSLETLQTKHVDEVEKVQRQDTKK